MTKYYESNNFTSESMKNLEIDRNALMKHTSFQKWTLFLMGFSIVSLMILLFEFFFIWNIDYTPRCCPGISKKHWVIFLLEFIPRI